MPCRTCKVEDGIAWCPSMCHSSSLESLARVRKIRKDHPKRCFQDVNTGRPPSREGSGSFLRKLTGSFIHDEQGLVTSPQEGDGSTPGELQDVRSISSQCVASAFSEGAAAGLQTSCLKVCFGRRAEDDAEKQRWKDMMQQASLRLVLQSSAGAASAKKLSDSGRNLLAICLVS